MISFLRFTVYAPLASWGDTAVGEIRGSWDRPSRSAVLGLVAAALGIRRDEDERHFALDGSLGIAVRMLTAGEQLIDYHTAQNPQVGAVKKRRPATRAEALTLDEPDTTLSRRWVRQDGMYLIALWERRAPSVPPLDVLLRAMRSPVFAPYAGRKANVLGLPLAPEIVEADSLAAALGRDPVLPDGFTALRPRAGWGREVAHDQCDGFAAALANTRTMIRRDAVPARSRWQFGDRTVHVGQIPAGAPA